MSNHQLKAVRTAAEQFWGRHVIGISDDGKSVVLESEDMKALRTGRRRDMVYETLRLMAWERAKAELYSILATYHEQTEEFDIIETHIGEFVERMEDRL